MLKSAFSQQSSNADQKDPHLWAPILELSVSSLLFLTGVLFSVYHGKQYFQERARASGIPSNKAYFSVQRQIDEAWKDSANQSKMVQSFLSNADSKKTTLAELNICSNEEIDALLADPAIYKKVLKIVARKEGFEFILEEDELGTVVGDHENRPESFSVASASHEGSTLLNLNSGEDKPLLFSSNGQQSYYTADKTSNVRPNAANDSPKPKRRSSFSG